MTATILELHGHGDELLRMTMKDAAKVKGDEEKPQVVESSHQVMGHGDPLFAEALSHDGPPKMALHSEFSGHGDEMLDQVIEHWTKALKEQVAKPKKLHEVSHTEFQMQGDPILKQYCDQIEGDGAGGSAIRASE